MFPTTISYFSCFQFLGKDGENFDMEKFYEDMTDSEDENDYHNDNESVRGRDDYYKEINFVRKVSQNFSWGKQILTFFLGEKYFKVLLNILQKMTNVLHMKLTRD